MTIIEWALATILDTDRDLFALIQKTLRHPILDYVMPWVSEPLAWVAPLTVIVACLFLKDKKRTTLFLLSTILLFPLADGSATALKGYFLRPRPDRPAATMKRLVERPSRSSFPSNHAANSFALATLVALYYPGTAAVSFATASVVGFSRIYLKSHYPLDVIGGALLGILMALAVAVATRTLRERWLTPRTANLETKRTASG